MPTIEFPSVPPYPGVPALVRGANIPTGIQVALGTLSTVLVNALASPTKWGIFDSSGNQLGGTGSGNGLLSSIVASLLTVQPILSNFSTEFTKEYKIADFPVEPGSFASYNKVDMPANPVVVLAFSGNQSQRTTFLNAIKTAAASTNLYSVVTPEVTYANYSIERYRYARKASEGATLLMVELSLKQIRQVSAAFSNVQTPINQPQNANATPQTNSGITQPTTPPQSTLSSIMSSLGLGGN